MSGRYSRTYSRRKAGPPPISQFDKLVTDPGSSSSTKPSATKTAGHVGKWGITSFTSLRSINGLGKDDSSKRFMEDSPPASLGDSAYSFDSSAAPANGAALQVKPPIKTFSRPRKFFKSRNAEDVPEPSKPAVDRVPARTGDGLYGVKAPALALAPFEMPDPGGSQGEGGSGEGGGRDSVFDKLVCGSVAPKAEGAKVEGARAEGGKAAGAKGEGGRPEGATSSRSGSGIKLKIFKSRNVASCSQEVYSSTVELPSDDSHAGSASTSLASSPSTRDLSEENRDSSEELAPPPSPPQPPQYKDLQVTLPPALSGGGAATYCSPDKDSLNRTLNATLDSSFEYSELMAQGPGLPLALCTEDRFRAAGNKANSDVPQCAAKLTHDAKFLKSGEVNKFIRKNYSTSASECDARPSAVPASAAPLPDYDVLSMGTGDFAEPRKSPPPLGSPGAAPGDGDTENFNLFGTDFDENEIVDRTSLDCGVAGGPLKDEGGLGDTQEMMEDFLFSTQGTLDPSQASAAAAAASYQAYKPGHRSKSETEASKKLCHQPLVKKRSIFKSRDADRDAKKRATYTHKWHGHEEKDDSARQQAPVPPNAQGAAAGGSAFDEFDFEMPTSLKRVQTWPGSSADPNDSTDNQSVTSVKCAKSAKQYYTVVKNVKRTHQLQESGEFQEFNDDVEYFLDALRCSYPVPTRCLAALNLAQKCMVPSFRMHLRAHGTVIKFFSALSDAHSDHRLAICAATVMFTLSQDRLNMDLDRDSLELMLNLLDTDMDAADTAPCPDAAFLQQNNRKIRELCHDMQKKGHAKHLNLENINAGHLAMETLLSLTSKRAGEWFKEELRALGGVEHLVRTITLCTEAFTPHHHTHAWTHPRLEKLSKVDRCLKVLENVTHQNAANQEYLLLYQGGSFPDKLMSLYRLCHVDVPLYPTMAAETQVGGVSTGQLLVQTLLTSIKVLINLTHSSGKEALGSKLLGNQQDLYDITLYCLLTMPRYLALDKKFELIILSCCLLLNLVEHSKFNRIMLRKTQVPHHLDADDDNIFSCAGDSKGAMQALVELFYRSEESARQQEAHTDDIIDHDLTEQSKQKDEDKKEDEIEETVAKLLQKAGHHMEDTLIAAYTALLTGYCIMEDKDCEAEIRAMLPDGNFSLMVTVLKKFLRFMDLTASTSLLRSLKPTERVVKHMEKLDQAPDTSAEAERKKLEAKELELDAFGF